MKEAAYKLKIVNAEGVDAQRFYQIAKGLHSATTFEKVDQIHQFSQKGTLISCFDNKHIAVNGPQKSLDIIARSDLSVIANLNTDGNEPFVVVRSGNYLIAGCNKGLLYSWHIDLGF